MFRRPPQFEVTDPQKPFEHDKLGREEHVLNLVQMMKGSDTPLVMTLSAPWGSGKSSFVKMWKAQLELEEHECILFDAWENDFNKEPLLACMGEIGEFIEARKEAASWYEQAKSGFKTCVDEIPGLLKASAGMASLLSLIVPGAGALATGLEACAGSVDKIKEYVEGGHTSTKDTVRKFKDGLREFVSSVSPEGKPLYFFVDELDRCEPEYAIRLLESVKHFFDVEGIVFVLSVDMAKLGSMAQTRYGSEFDANGYLSRFVDIEYSIPDPAHEKLINYLIFDVLKINELEHFTDEQCELFIDICSDCAKCFSASARDINRTLIKIYPLLCKRNLVSETGQIIFVNGKIGLNSKPTMYLCQGPSAEIISNFYYIYVILAFIRECRRDEFEMLPYGFEKYRAKWRESPIVQSYCYSFLMSLHSKMSSQDKPFSQFSEKVDLRHVLSSIGTALKAEGSRNQFLTYYKNKLISYDSINYSSQE